jgi:hypothetical protein
LHGDKDDAQTIRIIAKRLEQPREQASEVTALELFKVDGHRVGELGCHCCAAPKQGIIAPLSISAD